MITRVCFFGVVALLLALPAFSQDVSVSAGVALTTNRIGPRAHVYVIDPNGVIRISVHGDSLARGTVAADVVWPIGRIAVGPFVAGAFDVKTVVGAVGGGVMVKIGAMKIGVGAWFERGDVLGPEFTVGERIPVGPNGFPVPLRYEERGVVSTMIYVAVPMGVFK